jgi:hypothetical protein
MYVIAAEHSDVIECERCQSSFAAGCGRLPHQHVTMSDAGQSKIEQDVKEFGLIVSSSALVLLTARTNFSNTVTHAGLKLLLITMLIT